MPATLDKKFSIRAISRARKFRQVYVLLILGVVSLLAAWLIHPSTRDYPIGVLVLGLGMLISVAFNPYRLVAASFLTTLLGIAVFLAFKNLIPGNQVLNYYIVAMGLGLLGIALMARQGFIGVGAVTPALIVIAVGIIEYLLFANETPPNFLTFMLSLWLPGIGLLVLGVIYLFANNLSERGGSAT